MNDSEIGVEFYRLTARLAVFRTDDGNFLRQWHQGENGGGKWEPVEVIDERTPPPIELKPWWRFW